MAPEIATAATVESASPEADRKPSVVRALLFPNISEWAFVAILGWLFFGAAGAQTLLGDGDTGWHIRTGEYVLDHFALPPTDPFSFTMEGRVWFAWEWLADLILAVVYRLDGLEGVVLLTAAMIGAASLGMLRFLLWSRVNIFLAMMAMLMVSGVTTSHWLARPHMFTWVFFLATLWLLEADRRKNSRRVWLLVPLVALWVNIHGGFMALLLSVAVFGFGVGLEQLFAERRDAKDSFRFRIPAGWLRYGLVFAACMAATLINPYGYHLHEHVVEYLQSDFILNAVQEFQAPAFRAEAEKVFEVTLLTGLVVGGLMMRRGEFAWPLLMLVWAHATLTSFRHGALFMTVAAPVLAVEASRWLKLAAERGPGVWRTLQEIADDYGAGGKLNPVSSAAPMSWLPPAMLVFLAYSMNVRAADDFRWRAEFPSLRFPAKAADALGERLLTGRVLTSDQWGDYLVYRFYPEYKTFIDGRSDFYDPEVRNDYVRMLSAHFDWDKLLNKYEFDAILAPLEWNLTAAFKRHPEWRLVYDDGFALYFERRGRGEIGASEGTSAGGAEGVLVGRALGPSFRAGGTGDPLRTP